MDLEGTFVHHNTLFINCLQVYIYRIQIIKNTYTRTVFIVYQKNQMNIFLKVPKNTVNKRFIIGKPKGK